ncbi:cofactor-independent phosphoglycerate mutase [Methanofollis aquaemaris]|uniref:phosphoglycerate mutase (2,3-diphosphoglycerate-independent) n=1 Tax=Methanofollis aquaemaris TaxID=126734 RepID=A0A8A3S6P4_9EURY|nr:cofactor-independent phosphoglycerate mutase [Methanofollis aquaemaris]QSZ67957.1 cofactor-independent phosphoglycerate mutase [Methanofollis aquaemaris]
MKYIVVLGDGMADEPLEELGGQTPLEYADTPNMDLVAREGRCGLLKTVPDGFEPGSDVANLSVLSYDPRTCYTGRGPLEAASMGVDLGPSDYAYRFNLVTLREGVMEDFNAGHISSEEGAALISTLAVPGADLHPGVSYRNLMVVHEGEGSKTTPPHDIVGQAVAPYLPEGGDAPLLARCMEAAEAAFANHPVNRARTAAGKLPATTIWPWSGGKRPAVPDFTERWGLAGGMISAVDLLNGIAKYAGMEVVQVPGATGFIDTDYQAKARYAIKAIEHLDFIYIHVEAPDEAGHMGSVEEKVKAIEGVDGLLGTVLDHFDGAIALLPDHPTPVRLKTHTSNPVPFAVLGHGADSTQVYSESEATKGAYGLRESADLLPLLFGRKSVERPE